MFGVPQSLLTVYPLSYFGMLNLAKPGADGSFFVDRSPVVFDMVLAHLRKEDVVSSFRSTERPKLEQLLSDAVYYGLTELEAEVRKELEERWTMSPTANGTLLDGGLSLLKTGDLGGKVKVKKQCFVVDVFERFPTFFRLVSLLDRQVGPMVFIRLL